MGEDAVRDELVPLLPPEVEAAFRYGDLSFNDHGVPAAATALPESLAEQEEDHPPSKWFACRHPERPHERFRTVYHDCCRPCLIAAEAAGFSVVIAMRWRLETFGQASLTASKGPSDGR